MVEHDGTIGHFDTRASLCSCGNKLLHQMDQGEGSNFKEL
jgi:hypothetical protein